MNNESIQLSWICISVQFMMIRNIYLWAWRHVRETKVGTPGGNEVIIEIHIVFKQYKYLFKWINVFTFWKLICLNTNMSIYVVYVIRTQHQIVNYCFWQFFYSIFSLVEAPKCSSPEDPLCFRVFWIWFMCFSFNGWPIFCNIFNFATTVCCGTSLDKMYMVYSIP